MITGVIRNLRQRDEYISFVKSNRLPFKWAIQDLYPDRSLELNAYLWGVVYKMIADFTGHTTLEVHEGYLELFNLDYILEKDNTWTVRPRRTSESNTVELQDYILKIRIDALWMGVIIPLPNEVFINELNFTDEPLVDKKENVSTGYQF